MFSGAQDIGLISWLLTYLCRNDNILVDFLLYIWNVMHSWIHGDGDQCDNIFSPDFKLFVFLVCNIQFMSYTSLTCFCLR